MTGQDGGKSMKHHREMNANVQLPSFFFLSVQMIELSHVYLWCLISFQLTLIGNNFTDMDRSMFSRCF